MDGKDEDIDIDIDEAVAAPATEFKLLKRAMKGGMPYELESFIMVAKLIVAGWYGGGAWERVNVITPDTRNARKLLLVLHMTLMRGEYCGDIMQYSHNELVMRGECRIDVYSASRRQWNGMGIGPLLFYNTAPNPELVNPALRVRKKVYTIETHDYSTIVLTRIKPPPPAPSPPNKDEN